MVLAAKVKCAQWGYISDEPNCDQRLSKIDLLGLLVSNGCTAIIPTETSIHGLRRLQTQLLEAELWDLALEVSYALYGPKRQQHLKRNVSERTGFSGN